MPRQLINLLFWTLAALVSAGCDGQDYDLSTPDAAIASVHQMVLDGRADQFRHVIHLPARDITFDDGVTEESATREVIDKAGDMLGQLYRVALKLRERFPDQVQGELEGAAQRQGSLPFGRNFSRFLADPMGLLDEQRSRVSAEDLGDGTAAILIDGEPALGVGLLMRELQGQWKVEIPTQWLQEWRPETRHEWSVIASMMLSIENSLKDFEAELDRGDFRDLDQAASRAGRILGESVVVQVLLYQGMKEKRGSEEPPAESSGQD